MRRLPPLSSLRSFEAAARHRSFKAGAIELGVTATAISHQIRSLEDHIGLKLFDRRTRQVELTVDGRTLYPILRDGFDAFAAVVDSIATSQRRAVVNISATPAFVARWLIPRMHRFQQTHPDIDIRLHASYDVVDLDCGQFELAIRYGAGRHAGLDMDLLMPDRFAPLVNPSLRVRTFADIRKVPQIHFEWQRRDPTNPTWQYWWRKTSRRVVEPANHLRFSDESHAIQAAVAGQGIALLSLALVREELEGGRLVVPFGPMIDSFSYYLVRSPRRPGSQPVEKVRLWLLAEAEAERAAVR